AVIDILGPSVLMHQSDYPHGEAHFPRSYILPRDVEPRLDLGRQPIGEARDVRDNAAQPVQAVADLRGEVAIVPDAAQNDPQIGAFVCRRAFAPGTPLARDHPDAAITPRPRRGDDVAGDDRRQLLDDPRSAA